jgi:hypothetical protein
MALRCPHCDCRSRPVPDRRGPHSRPTRYPGVGARMEPRRLRNRNSEGTSDNARITLLSDLERRKVAILVRIFMPASYRRSCR